MSINIKNNASKSVIFKIRLKILKTLLVKLFRQPQLKSLIFHIHLSRLLVQIKIL